MKLLRWKVWSPWDIACLKWSCLLLGMVVGALLADRLRGYLLPLTVAGLLLAVRPAIAYLKEEGEQ